MEANGPNHKLRPNLLNLVIVYLMRSYKASNKQEEKCIDKKTVSNKKEKGKFVRNGSIKEGIMM